MSRLLVMADSPVLAVVLPGSAAEAAGLRVGDAIVSIEGLDWQAVARAEPDVPVADALANRLLDTGPDEEIRLDLMREGRTFTVRLTGPPSCRTRFIVQTDRSLTPVSDGVNIGIGTRFLAATQNDDEIALVAAHELAHVVYGDDETGDRALRRAMEDRADLLGVALVRCAGFDIERGLGFYRRFDRRDVLRAFRSSTHRPLRERIARMSRFAKASADWPCPPDRERYANATALEAFTVN